MRKYGDHYTADLYDPWAFLDARRRQVLEKGWAGLFKTKVLLKLPVAKIGRHFSSGMGAPTKDLFVAIGTLILQQIHDLPDAQAVEAVAFNIAWQYALDIRDSKDANISERTIRNYRALLIEHGLDEVLFQAVTDQLMKAFQVDPTRQRIDSTVLRSAMRKLGRLGTFTETLERFLRQLSRRFPEQYQQIDAVVRERYADGGKGMCFGACKPSEAARHLAEAAEDLLNLVNRFTGTEAAELKEFKLLERLLAEQCEVKGEGGRKIVILKDQKEVGGKSLQNPSDPDSTYNGHKGQGFMMQVMETYTEKPDETPAGAPAATPGGAVEGAAPDDAVMPAGVVESTALQVPAEPPKPDLITFVSLHGMTDYDGKALIPALEQTAARGVGPDLVLGDTHYGTAANPQEAADRGVELISPAQPAKGSLQEKLQLEDFKLDETGQVVACPAGHAPISVSSTDKNYQARFDAGVCAGCPLRDLCPVQKPRPSDTQATRLQYDKPRLDMHQRRKKEQEAEFKERYRWRAGIEGTMSRLKHTLGLAALRVRGFAAVKYEAFMGALGLNILRCAACAAAK